jgi:CelD/BcsL family acetyltransferase involved in cellulose biosynthesis
MRVEVLTRREDLAAISQAWDHLASQDRRDGFFRTFTWYQLWMTHVRPDAEPLVVGVRDSECTIVGLAPLCKLYYRDIGFRLAAIAFGGRDVVSGDFVDFVSDPSLSEVVTDAILGFLMNQEHFLVFGELIESGQLETALIARTKQDSIPLRRQEARICPYIELPDSMDKYLAGLSSATRYGIRRRNRDVLTKRGATIDVHTTPEALSSNLDTLISLHLARWRHDGLPGTLGRPELTAFLREIVLSPPPGAECRLYILNHESAPVAALLMFYFGDAAMYYQAGWNPDSPLANFSPAGVLMARTIEDAIGRGLRWYEFLRGDEAYKGRWTKTCRNTSTLLLGKNLGARTFFGFAATKDWAMANARSLRKRNTTAGDKDASESSDSASVGTSGGKHLQCR